MDANNKRITNAKRNINAGFFSRLISILIPFVSRTILLRIMGAEYLGLNSLFSSILNVLSLAELGIDSAITYNMYRPVAEGDKYQVCALLNLYRKLYKIVGIIIVCVGVCCIPFLDVMIHGDIPQDINTPILFVLFLINSSVGYFLYAYKRSLLIALQRNDIASNISTIVIVLQNILQIALYYTFRNFYLYVSVLPICTILSNLLCNIIANKKYGEYQPYGSINDETKNKIKKQIGGLIVTKLTMQSRNAFDSIVVSSFIGLTTVTMYANYFFVINSIHVIIAAILSSIMSVVGNSIALESKEKNYKDFNSIQYLYMWISIWAMSCVYIFYQNFMRIWAGENLLFPHFTMFLFALYGFLLTAGDVKGLYSEANGLWWHNKYFTLVEAGINIVLNIALGYLWGVNGIVIASIVSVLFSNVGYGPYTLFKHYFGIKNISRYLIVLFKYLACFLSICFISEWLCNKCVIDGILDLCIKGAITTCISAVIFLVANIRNPDAIEGKKLLSRMMHK